MTFFAQPRFLTGLLPVVALSASAAMGQTPRVVAGNGLKVAVNDPAAVSISVGGKVRPLHVAVIVDAALPASEVRDGRSDPQWVWLTGSPAGRHWQEYEKAGPAPAGSFDVRWSEPLTKAEFDSLKLIGADGKLLASGGGGVGVGGGGGTVWIDDTGPGWEALSRAALWVAESIPADQRAAAFLSLRTATETPGDHWRAALLRRSINPQTPAPPEFSPPALNTLAFQIGDQWAGAIGRLSKADAALGQQVARRLLQFAYLPTSDNSGMWTVIWADAEPQLRDTLLTAPSASLATAATSYLASQPSHIAWVRDDAGLYDGVDSSTLATVGVVSLVEQPVIATVTHPGRPGGEGDPVTVKPLIGQLFPMSVQRAGAASFAPANRTGGTLAAFKFGATPVSLPVAALAVPATPPGVLVGPFSLDWTLDSFRRQQPVRTGGIAASLLPAADDASSLDANAANSAPTTTHPQAWVLYLESRPPAAPNGDVEHERFRVWAGPSGAPAVCVEIGPGGVTSTRVGTTPVTAQVSRIPGGWCATVTLPGNAVDAKGTLRLGVEHTTISGLRSCWPRPMLPWQTEPGRLAIDTNAWNRELRP